MQLAVIAARKDLSMNALIGEIDAERTSPNLSSAIRVYILNTLVN